MRLFLKIKQDNHHVTLSRANFKPTTNTSDELIEFISKFLKIPHNKLILRTEHKGKHSIRLIKGWDLEHYHL